ncbi:diguanylate cyclase [Pseudomonas sp. BN515]|uniref:sensor domain-containing diguanylate cyclase n=1 Tax=Pseudomonas sp. BN515 TaxID=2567892 RepID=UPI0024568A35|nr:diguanylate cyclase [Pseudomonas sp. BN515]MDH4873667.1 diguanylate cyclase [Pseudomonas sp. BN515]
MSEDQKNNERSIWHVYQGKLGAPLALAVLVFIGCLLGILSRPENHLASLWLANATMAGFMLRVPASASPLGWFFSTVAFLAADLLTGSGLFKAGILTIANLMGVAATYSVYKRLSKGVMGIRQPMAVLQLAIAGACGAAASGLVGAVANPLLFGGGMLIGFVFWLVTEFANYIGILPVILSMPEPAALTRRMVTHSAAPIRWRGMLPVLGLFVSCMGAIVIGGPGAIAFPVPALLWCAVTYSVFATSLLTLMASAWMLINFSHSFPYDESLLISLRLGVFLIVPGPIMLSGVMQSNNKLLSTLKQMAARDGLTGVSNRLDFLDRAQEQLNDVSSSVGVMMIDLDHFKEINDTHGHSAGDAVLIAVAGRIQRCLRGSDLLGRLGGEEFAILIPGRSAEELIAVAERIRHTVADSKVGLPNHTSIPVTMSIGLVVVENGSGLSIERLLIEADLALYKAKNAGRNRVVLSGAPEPVS